MSKFETLPSKCDVKFDQIYAAEFDACGSNLKNAVNLTQASKVKFK
ncbi:hypothetical protein [uncultured Campylobacter sp.]|nr:hypothetical protein [uncultured Campylobacter sp.]